LLVIVAVAMVFTMFGLPYFSRFGHGLWAILVYLFLLVLFIYGRRNRPRKQHATRPQIRNHQVR
jgi:heme A synthase